MIEKKGNVDEMFKKYNRLVKQEYCKHFVSKLWFDRERRQIKRYNERIGL